jgi:hypothetical protein
MLDIAWGMFDLAYVLRVSTDNTNISKHLT